MQQSLLAPTPTAALGRTRCFRQARQARVRTPLLPCQRFSVTTRHVAVAPALPADTAAALPVLAEHANALEHAGYNLAASVPAPVYDVAEGLETPLQLLYLLSLLGLLSVGAYLVVRQVLVRRELDEAAKALGERIRTGDATSEDYFELGVILTRKKLYTQATKNLEKAKKVWEGEETELAQVHNALGFCYFNMGKNDLAIKEYQRAVELQPGYVTAWNNLGDVYETDKNWKQALQAYQEALSYAPNNKVALQRSDVVKTKVERLGLM